MMTNKKDEWDGSQRRIIKLQKKEESWLIDSESAQEAFQ